MNPAARVLYTNPIVCTNERAVLYPRMLTSAQSRSAQLPPGPTRRFPRSGFPSDSIVRATLELLKKEAKEEGGYEFPPPRPFPKVPALSLHEDGAVLHLDPNSGPSARHCILPSLRLHVQVCNGPEEGPGFASPGIYRRLLFGQRERMCWCVSAVTFAIRLRQHAPLAPYSV